MLPNATITIQERAQAIDEMTPEQLQELDDLINQLEQAHGGDNGDSVPPFVEDTADDPARPLDSIERLALYVIGALALRDVWNLSHIDPDGAMSGLAWLFTDMTEALKEGLLHVEIDDIERLQK